MFWIDLFSLLILSWWIVSRLEVTARVGERLALAALLGLGIKSLFIFLFLLFKVQPLLWRQLVVSVCALLLCGAWIRTRSEIFSAPSSPIDPGRISIKSPALWILGVLFILGLANALFFPITGADGVWYHVKGMVYFHEADFESERIISQFRQYPPMIGLLYAWLISGGIEQLPILFPVLYLCLLAVVYHRILDHTGSTKVAGGATLVLGTTPYLWWHSFLPFLDWTAGVFYAVGMLYWFFLVQTISDSGAAQLRPLTVLSGLFFGLASWTRPEFVLYSALPLFLLVCVLDRQESPAGERNPVIARFSMAALILPTLWFAVLLNFEGPLGTTFKQLIMACAGLWTGVGLVLSGGVRFTPRMARGTVICAVAVCFAGLFLFLPADVSPWTALAVRCFRLFAVHLFFAGTSFLVVFLFTGGIRQLSPAEKTLGVLLLLFPLTQFIIYAYSGLKWPTLYHFIDTTFVHPGNSVNLSDTRGTIAFYPAFIFFLICIPKIKEGISSGFVRRIFLAVIAINLTVVLTMFAGPRIKFIAENLDRPFAQWAETVGPFDLPNQFQQTYRVVNRVHELTSSEAVVFLPPGDRAGSFRSVATQVLYPRVLHFGDDADFEEKLNAASREGRAYLVSGPEWRPDFCSGEARRPVPGTAFGLCGIG
ncbi:hypothetical protein UZ36_01365 [Candidatus Nitromaritima sp. SCGC AAA799-C22]|nr:hypothetical protein UZ36_01365 [Candidatus Nitromaritima sp. SCGC AAA799-C22]